MNPSREPLHRLLNTCLAIVAFIPLSVLAASSDTPSGTRHFDIHIADDLRSAKVRRCISDSPHDDAPRCRDYRTRLASEGRWDRYFPMPSESRLVGLERLPGLPTPGARYRDTQISIHTPPGTEVSAPWPLLNRSDGEAHYRLPYPYTDWDGRLAIGRMQLQELESGGSHARVAILDSQPPVRNDQMLRWLQQGLDAITSVYGRFPLDSVQVLVTPIGRNKGEVPWGQVMRGGYPSVHLFVDQTDPYPTLLDDWTLFHELSHLYIPLVYRSDRWLSEGLASYYQTVARARSGLLDVEDGWERLLGGMQNGIVQADEDTRFSDVLTEGGWSRIRLIYWTGAAIFFKADVALREASDNRQSLDTVLGEFQRCCLPSGKLWTAEELLGEFDRIAGRPVFRPLAADYLQRTGFPDIEIELQRLGVRKGQRGQVSLDRNAPLAAVAQAIMATRPQEDLATASAGENEG